MKLRVIKFISASFALAVAFSSCSNEENVGKQTAISFKGLSNKAVRATVTDGLNFLDFKVYAYANSNATLPSTGVIPDFMNGVKVSRANTTAPWLYTPEKYWPVSDYVHFYAYGPHGSTSAVWSPTGANQPIIDYTVAGSVLSQEDFIWAKAEACNKTNNSSAPVALTFKHALSQVVFQAKSGIESLKFNVTKVELLGAKNFAQFNLRTGLWGTPSGSANYDLSGTAIENNTAIDNTKFYTLSATAGAMMLMPQTLAAGNAVVDLSSGTYLRITYGATDISSGAVVVSDGTVLTVPFGLTLVQNKKYTIQMTLKATGELTKIEFSGSVDDWDNGDTAPINM